MCIIAWSWTMSPHRTKGWEICEMFPWKVKVLPLKLPFLAWAGWEMMLKPLPFLCIKKCCHFKMNFLHLTHGHLQLWYKSTSPLVKFFFKANMTIDYCLSHGCASSYSHIWDIGYTNTFCSWIWNEMWRVIKIISFWAPTSGYSCSKFSEKNGIVGNLVQWRGKSSWDPILGNADCEIFWIVEEFQKEV